MAEQLAQRVEREKAEAASEGKGKGKGPPTWVTQATLGISAVGLLALTAVQLWSLFGWYFMQYGSGASLINRQTSHIHGTVLQFEEGHRFGSGAVADAYFVQPENGEVAAWFPKKEIHMLFRTN